MSKSNPASCFPCHVPSSPQRVAATEEDTLAAREPSIQTTTQIDRDRVSNGGDRVSNDRDRISNGGDRVSNGGDRISIRAIGPFLLMTFGLAWGVLALFIFLPDQMARLVGELSGRHPLFYLAVYAPAIAAFAIVARRGGVSGLRRYLSRALLWRCPPAWYGFLIVGIPLLFIGGSAWKGNLLADPFPFSSLQSLVVAMVLAAMLGPMEEFGWRGLALPLLQRKMMPISAALVLGVIWGVWHLPAFVLNGTQQSEWSFSAFFIGCIALSIIVTALFNASRGSILLAALFHFLVMNPMLPDAQPYDTYLFSAVAIGVVLIDRKRMFSRAGAETGVIPRQGGGHLQ